MSDDVVNDPGNPVIADRGVAKPPPLPIRNKKTRRGQWKLFAFANSATRPEAKAILFQELSVATANGMPLDEALEMAVRSERDRVGGAKTADEGGPWSIIQTLVALIYIFFSSIGVLLLLLLTSVWATDVERVARVLAMRLLPFIRAGHSLSSAMAMLRSDYSPQEVSIIRAGESWNNLPTALEKLGQFQYYERELQRHWARMMYPLWLFLVMGTIMTFSAVFILPKFKDIYDQLGAELPGITQLIVDVAAWATSAGMPFLFLLLGLISFIMTIRLLMVGNRTLRDIAAGGLFILGIVGINVAMFAFSDAAVDTIGSIGVFIVVILSAILPAMVLMAVLSESEKLVLWLERTASRWFGNIPVIGAPRRTEMESRWLAALSLGLSSGIEAPVAIEAAGDICGGSLARSSRRAAELAGQGHSIGEAVVKARVLRPRYANRLRLLDGRPGYLADLADISEDAARDSFHTLNRASRIAEVATVCVIGVSVAIFAIAMYVPLFQIPQVVGHY